MDGGGGEGRRGAARGGEGRRVRLARSEPVAAAEHPTLVDPALDAAAIAHPHAERAALEHTPLASAAGRRRCRRRRGGSDGAARWKTAAGRGLRHCAVASCSSAAALDASDWMLALPRELHGARDARGRARRFLEQLAGLRAVCTTGDGCQLVARWSGRDGSGGCGLQLAMRCVASFAA